ncbi:hypothetical protein [Amycolatopsis nigrescens]|nr:hypothetical protein [Amycolatopsis nigrescens]
MGKRSGPDATGDGKVDNYEDRNTKDVDESSGGRHSTDDRGDSSDDDKK